MTKYSLRGFFIFLCALAGVSAWAGPMPPPGAGSQPGPATPLVPPSGGAPVTPAGNPTSVYVSVPTPDTQLYFDDYLTAEQGLNRVFVYDSSSLDRAREYGYDVRAVTSFEGQVLTGFLHVSFRPGDVVNINFTLGQNAYTSQPILVGSYSLGAVPAAPPAQYGEPAGYDGDGYPYYWDGAGYPYYYDGYGLPFYYSEAGYPYYYGEDGHPYYYGAYSYPYGIRGFHGYGGHRFFRGGPAFRSGARFRGAGFHAGGFRGGFHGGHH